MKQKYIPKTLEGKLAWMLEECAEVAQAIAKTQRVMAELGISAEEALDCFNPDLPSHEQESNRDWILREMKDLKVAHRLLKCSL